jgi:MYXO-CTERM domain-containing protein
MKCVRPRPIGPLLLAPALLLAGATVSAETRDEMTARLSLAGKAVPTVSLGCANPAHEYRCAGVAVADEGGAIRRRPHAIVPAAGGTPGTSSFEGYLPSDLASAYGLTAASANGGAGKTVAVIDAFTFPTALSDVNEYRKEAGFPAYNSAGGPTFAEYPATGTTLPGEDPEDSSPQGGWGDETMLDLEMVSAACPACNVIIIEPSGSGDNEGFNAAPGVAASKGAVAISNSYGSDEDPSIVDDPTFNLGVLVTASAGDSGYGASYPATSPYVVAVGGTNLVPDTSGGARGWNEYLWAYSPPSKANGEQASGTGSGCSQYVPTPAFQAGLLPSGITSLCSKRMEVDLAADADPYTGVQVILTISGQLEQGVVGGTSASSPFVAAMMVRFGLEKEGNSFVYGSVSNGAATMFNDITTATPDTGADEAANTNAPNAQQCGLMCMAATGYDGPTGWGSPNGAAWSLGGIDAGNGGIDAGTPSGSTVDAGGAVLEDAGPALATSDGGAFPASGSSTAGCGCAIVGAGDASRTNAGLLVLALGLVGVTARRASRSREAGKVVRTDVV